jgi:hypothetical protein
MANPDVVAKKLRTEFDARWKAAIERPPTPDTAVHPDSVAGPATIEVLLGHLGQLAKTCAAEGLISPEQAERVVASADNIREIMGGIDPKQLASVARQIR